MYWTIVIVIIIVVITILFKWKSLSSIPLDHLLKQLQKADTSDSIRKSLLQKIHNGQINTLFDNSIPESINILEQQLIPLLYIKMNTFTGENLTNYKETLDILVRTKAIPKLLYLIAKENEPSNILKIVECITRFVQLGDNVILFNHINAIDTIFDVLKRWESNIDIVEQSLNLSLSAIHRDNAIDRISDKQQQEYIKDALTEKEETESLFNQYIELGILSSLSKYLSHFNHLNIDRINLLNTFEIVYKLLLDHKEERYVHHIIDIGMVEQYKRYYSNYKDEKYIEDITVSIIRGLEQLIESGDERSIDSIYNTVALKPIITHCLKGDLPNHQDTQDSILYIVGDVVTFVVSRALKNNNPNDLTNLLDLAVIEYLCNSYTLYQQSDPQYHYIEFIFKVISPLHRKHPELIKDRINRFNININSSLLSLLKE
ncbi:hypothetical protein PPL_09245 [Heterostelium album PN500]|uniref:Uncharacterized protein n=1 Tax=Heterostelium pallidum (strain ATCC 26659 / Pp 5 / PN500) TaxID=670386 RepID=D3BL13_HETP5|nr:hypothetical protein PPL_09245 [Heterostelium album PN500]EFA78593.1 hypothetical protein PPL_09245 [Heterostelium album PN500]|eukprot:XP_020430717.1 hypothetical protein PPL_09245 [Heterostelium album PN500]